MADEFASWRSLDNELGNLLDTFTNLVKASRIPEETTDQSSQLREKVVPGDLLDVWSEKLLFSAYMCHHHISELKKGAALSDFEGQITEGRMTREALTKSENLINTELALLRQEATLLLHRLELSYYSSAHRGEPVKSTGISEQLRQLTELALESQSGV